MPTTDLYKAFSEYSLIMKSNILKLAIFATGISGIVAEYILSTLASYFLGDSVTQWALTVSIMLFAMGLGSRISKRFSTNLLVTFVGIEFLLSVLVSYSSLMAYTAASFSEYSALIIYSLSILIGMLIGMEIPLVIRLNDEFETLKINVSSVIENDYYGSLIGGLFFVFVGLPHLGLTYTPFALGLLNLTIALLLFWYTYKEINQKKRRPLLFSGASVAILLVAGIFIAKPIILFGEQKKYKDKVVYSEQSKYQRIVITQWKDDYWLFLNGHEQLSTIDEVMYHEPLVHPPMSLHPHPQNVLIMGGGDGCAAREVLKYQSVEHIDVVDLDPAMTKLATQHPILTQLNQQSFSNTKVKVHNDDGFHFMQQTKQFYDVIIIDLPDPRSVELGRLYSIEFYKMCRHQLRPGGTIITQAGSPYYATRAFKCINQTMKRAGFATLPLHNQVLSLGEWGWILGQKTLKTNNLKQKARQLTFTNKQTNWINKEAMLLITSFGKDINFNDTTDIEINRIHNPVLHKYYLKGNWDLY